VWPFDCQRKACTRVVSLPLAHSRTRRVSPTAKLHLLILHTNFLVSPGTTRWTELLAKARMQPAGRLAVVGSLSHLPCVCAVRAARSSRWALGPQGRRGNDAAERRIGYRGAHPGLQRLWRFDTVW